MNEDAPVIEVPEVPHGAFHPERPMNELQQSQIAQYLDAITRTVHDKLPGLTEGTAAGLIFKLTVALEALNE